ncbi:hypothetical protein M1D97_10465 [Kushneria sp. AK178]
MIRTTRISTPRGPVSLAYSTPTRAAAELAAHNGWRLSVRAGRLAMVEQ